MRFLAEADCRGFSEDLESRVSHQKALTGPYDRRVKLETLPLLLRMGLSEESELDLINPLRADYITPFLARLLVSSSFMSLRSSHRRTRKVTKNTMTYAGKVQVKEPGAQEVLGLLAFRVWTKDRPPTHPHQGAPHYVSSLWQPFTASGHRHIQQSRFMTCHNLCGGQKVHGRRKGHLQPLGRSIRRPATKQSMGSSRY